MGTHENLKAFWSGKVVLLTGHTGFKGAWLALWLEQLGAKVHGLALAPETRPNAFEVLGIEDRIASSRLINMNDFETVQKHVIDIDPDVVFHLAAQALVRKAYKSPLDTFATNIMGTAHILEAIRSSSKPISVIAVTTDKVYHNKEWIWPYRENDPLGGHEPYSASKSGAEHVISAYRQTYFNDESGIKVVSVRAGNVIGGGDWAKDRLIPDAIESFSKQIPLILRNPSATRPWQHVFEPLLGYMIIAEKLENNDLAATAMNFGPDIGDVAPVDQVSKMLARAWGHDAKVEIRRDQSIQESRLLALDNNLARNQLGWLPRLSLEHAISETVLWYKAHLNNEDMLEFSLKQLACFEDLCVL